MGARPAVVAINNQQLNNLHLKWRFYYLMEKLENFVNHCYLESDDGFFVLVYKIIKKDGKYGMIGHNIEIDPYYTDITEDYFQPDEVDYAYSFIPELCPTCEAQEISEEKYYELTAQIEQFANEQTELHGKIKKFIKHELGKEV